MAQRDQDWRQNPRSHQYVSVIEEAAKANDVPVELLGSLLQRENGFRADGESHAGAVGIAQIIPKWHPGVDPTNPVESIKYAAKYLDENFERFGSWDKALAAYNHGPTDVAKYGDQWESRIPPETVAYVNALSPDRVAYAPPSEDTELLEAVKRMNEAAAERQKSFEAARAQLETEVAVEETQKSRGWWTDVGASILRGPINAVRQAIRTNVQGADLSGFLTGQWAVSAIAPEYTAARVAEFEGSGLNKAMQSGLDALGAPETKTGGFAESLSQFLTGYALTRKAMGGAPNMLKGTQESGRLLRELATGGYVAGTSFQEHEANLANLVQHFPALQNPITEFMQSKDDDSVAVGRLKNVLMDAVGGVIGEKAVQGLAAGVSWIKGGRRAKAEVAAELPDSRPELDIESVGQKNIAQDNPLPEVLPESSPSAIVPAAKAEPVEFTPATGETIIRTKNGTGIATETDNSIRMNRVDVTEAARGNGEGLSILRRFAQRAHERGLPLFSDVSVSPAQVRVYEKLKAEGFDVRRNEATVNPETGNLVSTDPRKPVFEVAPKAAETVPAKPVIEAPPTTLDEAAPQPAPAKTQEAVEPKASYADDSIDAHEARLRKEIGLTDELIEEVRGKVQRGEVKPEEVADLIGLNGSRIDWSGIADEKAMAGLLNTITRTIDTAVGGAARYARVSVETVERLGKSIGATADEAYKLFHDLKAKGGIEARMMAARSALAASAAKLYRLGTRVANGTALPEELLELAVHDRRHMLLQATVRGSSSMIARSLRMMRETVAADESAFRLSKARHERTVRAAKEGVDKAKRKAKPRPDGKVDSGVEHAQSVLDNAKKANRKLSEADVQEALGSMGYTPKQIKKLGQTIARASNADQLNKVSRTVGFGKQMQSRLATLYINNILSGFPTFAVNVTAGWLKMAETVIERYGAGVVGYIRGGDKYDLIAAHRAVIQTKVAWGSAWKIAAAAWKEGLPQTDLFGRAEVAMQGGTGTSLAGKIITSPSRAILTIDEYFKHVFYQQELAARAVEISAGKARLAGKNADAVFEREFKAIMENPADDVRLDAIENARYQTFQNALKSDMANGLIRWTNGAPILKLVVPFVRTPVNIVKQALDRSALSPLQLLKSDMRASIASGSRAGNTELVRMTLAVSAAGVIFEMALDGKISGSRVSGRRGKNSADIDEQLPYTIGGVQYNRFDPWGTTIALTADVAHFYQEWQMREALDESPPDQLVEAFSNVMAILQTNITDKTFFKGIADFVDMAANAKDDPRAVGNYFANLGTSLVPFSSMTRNMARSMDDVQREAFDFSDKLTAQIPGMRETLPVKRDFLGRPIEEAGRLGPDWLSPIAIAKDDTDPAAKAFANLEMPYSMPDKSIGGVRLTAEQYSRLCEVRGQFIHEHITSALQSGAWEEAGNLKRQDMVRAWMEAGGQKARASLFRDSEARDGDKNLRALIKLREAANDARIEAQGE